MPPSRHDDIQRRVKATVHMTNGVGESVGDASSPRDSERVGGATLDAEGAQTCFNLNSAKGCDFGDNFGDTCMSVLMPDATPNIPA